MRDREGREGGGEGVKGGRGCGMERGGREGTKGRGG